MAIPWKELKAKQTPELVKLLKEQRENVRDLRFRISANQHKDVREVREAKQFVAQILTLLNERKRNGDDVAKRAQL